MHANSKVKHCLVANFFIDFLGSSPNQNCGFQLIAKDLHGLKPRIVVKAVAPFVAMNSSVVTNLDRIKAGSKQTRVLKSTRALTAMELNLAILAWAEQLVSVCCSSAPICIQIFRLPGCHSIAVITALSVPI